MTRWLDTVTCLIGDVLSQVDPDPTQIWAVISTVLLGAVVGADGLAVTRFDAARSVRRAHHIHALPGVRPSPDAPQTQVTDHPLHAYYAATGSQEVLRVHDLVSGQAWRRTQAAAWLRDIGIRYSLAIPLPAAGGQPRAVMLGRATHPFTDGQVEHARAVQPFLHAVDRHLASRALYRPALTEAHAARTGSGELRAQAAALRVGLTAREQMVLRARAEGLTMAQVGMRLGISERTVEDHVRRIRAKLGTRDYLSTLRAAHALGLLD